MLTTGAPEWRPNTALGFSLVLLVLVLVAESSGLGIVEYEAAHRVECRLDAMLERRGMTVAELDPALSAGRG